MSPHAWLWFRRILLSGNLLAPVFAVGMACLGHPLVGFGLGVLVYLALHWAMFKPASQWLGPVMSRFAPSPPGAGEVWITIDDGPDPADTPALLDLLAARKAKATFFFIGEKAQKFPDLVRRAAAEGHGIGHHTFSHPAHLFWLHGPGATCSEIARGREAVRLAAGLPEGTLLPFRAPAGFKNPFMHACLAPGEPLIAWSIRAFDTKHRRADEVVRRLMQGATPGAILLMHEGVLAQEGGRLAPAVLAKLLDALEEKGMKAVVPA